MFLSGMSTMSSFLYYSKTNCKTSKFSCRTRSWPVLTERSNVKRHITAATSGCLVTVEKSALHFFVDSERVSGSFEIL